MVPVNRSRTGFRRPVAHATAALSATVILGSCANSGPPHPPPRPLDVSVSVSLNGAAPNQQLALRPGTVINASVTMTVGRGVTLSAFQLGVLGGASSGSSEGGACGVQVWVYQHRGLTKTGTYHYDTSFVAQAFRGIANQPMKLAAYITSSTPSVSEASIVAMYVIAPIAPADESTASPATPPCP